SWGPTKSNPKTKGFAAAIAFDGNMTAIVAKKLSATTTNRLLTRINIPSGSKKIALEYADYGLHVKKIQAIIYLKAGPGQE
ncbi:MAG: hypothetical protein OET18_01955, partial [Desulfobacterales bacterium]|nr:hypothetical protein [Desulfobacterales bacterium]